MQIDLASKNALICGSSRGIGKAIAFKMAEAGANVTMVARDKNDLEDNLKNLSKDQGQNHDYIVMDFDDTGAVIEEMQSIRSNTYHILVNNSGGPSGGPLYQAATEEFQKAYHRHLIVNHLLMLAVIDNMREENYGRIINIISTSVKQPIPGLGVSNTVRGAVANWSKTLATELGAFGITVNNILPGFTETDRLNSIIENNAQKQGISKEEVADRMRDSVPLKRFAKAEETAYAAVFLASPVASYINGINLPVDGGRTSCL